MSASRYHTTAENGSCRLEPLRMVGSNGRYPTFTGRNGGVAASGRPFQANSPLTLVVAPDFLMVPVDKGYMRGSFA
jgi:hypothetical protein